MDERYHILMASFGWLSSEYVIGVCKIAALERESEAYPSDVPPSQVRQFPHPTIPHRLRAAVLGGRWLPSQYLPLFLPIKAKGKGHWVQIRGVTKKRPEHFGSGRTGLSALIDEVEGRPTVVLNYQ